MEETYLEKIEEYLNKKNIQMDSNGNITINKFQLLDCFLFLQNSKNIQNINENNIKNNQNQNRIDNIIKSKDLQNKKIVQLPPKQNFNNFDDMPLPAQKNKDMENLNKISSDNNNIEDIPLKGGANFNDILEKELLKDKNNEYANNENKNIEPKFKYVPKKNKRDIISAPPTNAKKYKYYSDNFKSKKKKKESQNNKNQIENFNENEKLKL